MAEGKFFNIALSCSLVWHLLCIQAVSIVWPAKLIRPQFSAINFWGPILENTSFTPEQLTPMETSVVKNANAEVIIKEEKLASIDKYNTVLEKKSLPLAELAQEEKLQVDVNVPMTDKLFVTETLSGQINRSVIYKPELPSYPGWAKEIGGDFEIGLKFLILPDGMIGNVEKITLSGYPELDEIGVRYIRKWKFMPLSEDVSQEEQWGEVKLLFRLQ